MYHQIDSEVHVSYLPLAHIFETVVQAAVYCAGGGVGFFQGNVKKLTNDFLDLQPTILCGVPRVFSKVITNPGRSSVRTFHGFAPVCSVP